MDCPGRRLERAINRLGLVMLSIIALIRLVPPSSPIGYSLRTCRSARQQLQHHVRSLRAARIGNT
ncbi:hypothetical protein C8Q76DRAFT_726551 [Earliella scabrosa]|nr:hypothetical protein C8Q76DRAFT_726551 [Earliella scabrosa]